MGPSPVPQILVEEAEEEEEETEGTEGNAKSGRVRFLESSGSPREGGFSASVRVRSVLWIVLLIAEKKCARKCNILGRGTR